MISKAVDFGRILAASLIFYFHVGLATHYPFSRWGEFAVGFFIILSGVTYILFASSRPHDLASYRRYVGGRLASIFPVYFLINVVVYAASFVYPSALGRPFTFVEFLLSASGLSELFHYRYLSHGMWFIPFIIQAYFLFPIIARMLDRVSGTVLMLSAFAISISLITLVFHCWPSHATDICRNWSAVFRLPEICIGVILGRAFRSRPNVPGAFCATATFVLLSFLLATVVSPRFIAMDYILTLPWHGLLVSVIIAIGAIAMAATIREGADVRLLRLAGNASYPFFLTHGIAILFVFRRFGNMRIPWIFYFAMCWGFAIGFAYVFQHVRKAYSRKNQQ